MQRKLLWALALSLSLVSLSAVASAALSSVKESHVVVRRRRAGGNEDRGRTSDLSVADDGENVVITVPLGNLTTGIGLRDHHMKEKYLEVPKYPSATLTIARSALKFPHDGEALSAEVPATLQLHGQTRPVTVHYEAKAAGQRPRRARQLSRQHERIRHHGTGLSRRDRETRRRRQRKLSGGGSR